ncbi:uncharacterized protein (DUF1501 family) [Rhodoblastus acidophilus]|uniref:DUF1501 domain-containing protein n=1 Tax=Rhodoblastus acidophilus TaxID=1074 RepID=UPI0022256905|nr:DUF1501 domain-containing protein [Rhodoblastus acidophilus]MCW2318598.1 uncharacterized protein (DUF1501 family) [Rhodoblastus acidophilus]
MKPIITSRRGLLRSSGAVFAWSALPRFARASSRDPRLIVVILRGALDGLSTVAPVGDPDYAALHGTLALSIAGDKPALPLDGFFALHPAMPVFKRLFDARQALAIHAVATCYRERSHFDGQDVLESGQPAPGRTDSGWLNRALTALPTGERASGRVVAGALGVGPTTPLVLRGPAPVFGWSPQTLPPATDDLAARLLDLYAQRDPALAHALADGLNIEKIAARQGMTGEAAKPRGGADSAQGMRQAAQGAARLMAADDGPRVAALAFDGWDTHASEGGAGGRLAQLLGGLDGAFEELEKGLGDAWRSTAIVVVTEFGRTARINGTAGTDHGTATVALLAGGAVAGGRVIADWPGLAPARLYQNRDLAPTTDLRAALGGLLAEHLGLSRTILATAVFPQSEAIRPMKGLIAG